MPVAATTEPDSLTAGDTLAWTKTVSDYPASSGWTLHYALLGSSGTPIGIDAAASGADHAVNVSATTSATWKPGVYAWVSYVIKAAERYSVARGSLTIFADPTATIIQSHAVKTLALIEAALEGRIPRGLENTNIDGQQLDRIPLEGLERLKTKYERRVRAEQNTARAAAGLRPRGIIGVRFANA